MKTPDHHTSKLGSKEFVFQVNKWPFSITCNPLLPTISETFIDLALVKDMKITMKRVECRNISYGGLSTKLVGSISQTLKVVYNGVASGTMHLKAKVIRNLTNLFGVDCIASHKLYKVLTSAAPNLDSSVASNVSSSASMVTEENDVDIASNEEVDISADELVHNAEDSPKTWKRKRRNRFQVANLSFTGSMLSSPPTSPRSSTPTPHPSQVPNSMTNLTSLSPGHPPMGQTRQEPPPQPQSPPMRLTDLILCGHAPPCSCVETLRDQQLQLLPPLYPVYLPVGHLPCSPACVSHHVHGDHLHPPDPRLCSCDPPRVQPGYVRGRDVHLQYVPFAPTPEASPKTESVPDAATAVQPVAYSELICVDCESSACPGDCPESQVYQHISSVGHLHHGGGHDDEPPLPPDFQPCGNYCGYQICQCLRNYEGRDWAS